MAPDSNAERPAFLRLEKSVRSATINPKLLVRRLHGEVDVFILPTYTGSFGYPLAEAMASGLPVVALMSH
jgi:glycosyltransferase involved in cell wall biosynthesis